MHVSSEMRFTLCTPAIPLFYRNRHPTAQSTPQSPADRLQLGCPLKVKSDPTIAIPAVALREVAVAAPPRQRPTTPLHGTQDMLAHALRCFEPFTPRTYLQELFPGVFSLQQDHPGRTHKQPHSGLVWTEPLGVLPFRLLCDILSVQIGA